MKSLKLIGLALGTSLALSTAALAQDITVGVAGPMTGGESAFGRQMKNGAEQAVKDLNAGGGLLGKKLALEVGDERDFRAGEFLRHRARLLGIAGIVADFHRELLAE